MNVRWTLLVLQVMVGAGLCCTGRWRAWDGKCYSIFDHELNSSQSAEFCLLVQGDLAAYNRQTEFLQSLPGRDESSTYRLADQGQNNHFLVDHTWSVPKSVCKQTSYDIPHKASEAGWPCDQWTLPFLCEKNVTTLSCPEGFEAYQTMCLRAFPDPATEEEAVDRCTELEGRLAVFDTPEKESDGMALMAENNETFWLVGIRRSQDTHVMEWSSGEVFHSENFRTPPEMYDPHAIREEDLFLSNDSDCVGLRFQMSPTWRFESKILACHQRWSYICEHPSNETTLLEEDTTTSTSDVTSTDASQTPLYCPIGMNWKLHSDSGFCFWETTYETEKLNWFQAREFCQKFGGDLASYADVEQETIGLSGAREHYKGLWIGLERDEHDVFHWVDGSPLIFTNWNENEPNMASKTKFCVTHSPGSPKWQLDYCGVRRWFVCKAPRVTNRTAVDTKPKELTSCKIEGVSVYRRSWYQFRDHCYLVHDGKYTWDTAKVFCHDNDAFMASIHSFEETNFVLNLLNTHSGNNFWIGLSAPGLHSSYQWSDSSPLDFIYWADERNEDSGPNTCISFDKVDGSWNNEHCNRLQGVVCKRGLNASYDFTTTEVTTIMPGNCEEGWYNYGNNCFKFFGKLWTQRVAWQAAKQECEKMGASLASVHSEAEQDFVTDVLFHAGADLWIGLQSKEGGTVFHWTDDSRMDYVNWGEGEPHHSSSSDYLVFGGSKEELCVILEHQEASMGKWNDIGCLENKAYLCEKRKNPELKQPSADPFSCPNITGWTKLGSSCYGIFGRRRAPWLEAQAECRKSGANLVTVRNGAVAAFLARKLEKGSDFFWMGVREKEPDEYESVGGFRLFYSNWMVRQPTAASHYLDNCVAMSSGGKWLVKSCRAKLPYICMADFGDFRKDYGLDGHVQSCDAGTDWYSFGGSNCFKPKFESRMHWYQAMNACFRSGGFLASVHSANDTKGILKLARHVLVTEERTKEYIYIGLGNREDASLSWVDGSAVDYVNWEEQPSRFVVRTCVAMSILTGKWRTMSCDEDLGFVCSLPKNHVFEKISEKSSSIEVDENAVIAHKLTVGGVFGIVICLLVILAIVGVAIYYLRPKKEVQPNLLDPDSL